VLWAKIGWKNTDTLYSNQAHLPNAKISEIPQANRSCNRNTWKYGQVSTYGGLPGDHVLEAYIGFSWTAQPSTSNAICHVMVTAYFLFRQPGSEFSPCLMVSDWTFSFAGLQEH